MPNAKVRPLILFYWPDHDNNDNNNNIMHPNESLQLTDKWEDDYGSGNRHDRHYWHARQAFLKSYHLSLEQSNDLGFKWKAENLKRSVKGMNEAVMGVVLDIRKEMSKKRLGFRVLRIKLHLSSLAFMGIRCFTPWLHKSENSLGMDAS